MSTNEVQQRGRFIIFEGGEGAGKSTLIKNLYNELTKEGHNVVTTREPGGSPYAEEIREILLRKRESSDQMPTPRAQLFGLYTARTDHIERTIIPALKNGAIVLCDRFELSSYAYQIYAQESELEELFKMLHAQTLEILRSYDCTYVLCDIDPEVGVKRALTRKGVNTVFDEMDMSFHYKVRDGLKQGRKAIDPHFAFIEIDASLSENELVKATRKLLRM